MSARLFMAAFYWNASRATESAAALGLLKRDDRYRLFDAVRVRNKLIEHEDAWSRPAMTHGANPALKPGAEAPPNLTAAILPDSRPNGAQ